MGTRGYIYVKVRESDMGTSLEFDRKKLDDCVRVLDEAKYNGNDHDPLDNDNIFRKTECIGKPFLGIYNQCDSYPSGTGLALVTYFGDYERALNLMAGGMTECIFRNTIMYSAARRDSVRGVKEYENDLSELPIQHRRPLNVESYQYLFFEGRWYVRTHKTYWHDVRQMFDDCKGVNPLDVDCMAYYGMEELEEYKAIPAWSSCKSEAAKQRYDEAWEKTVARWHQMLPTPENVRRLDIAGARRKLEEFEQK